jgi:hypothetical protein
VKLGRVGWVALFTLAVLAGVFNTGKAFAFSGAGTGTSGDPFQITTCAQLDSMNADLSADYVLQNDIDCSGAGSLNGGTGWSPIGGGTSFSGTLDGQNHKINKLDLSGMPSTTNYEGMFSQLTGAAVVENLQIIQGKVNGHANVGMVAGGMFDSSRLDNVYVDATITCHAENCGGMTGSLHDASVINNSGADETLTGDSQSVGGLVGYISDSGTITESFANGNVSGALYVGGLVGAINNNPSTATITNAYSSATVTDTSDYAGGLVGWAASLNLTKAYAAGSVSGSDSVGGLVGLFSGFMAETFSAEKITGTGGAVGPVTGSFGSGSVGNRYFDTVITGFSSSPDGSSAITSIDYFKDNSTNPPFDQWDFTTIWRTNYANYPSFAPKIDPYMLCEEPNSTKTTITGSCEVQPLGWGTPSWLARWSKHGANKWHTLTLGNAHKALATVSGLTPGTWYDLEFRYTNNFGTGPWGKLEILTTGKAPVVSRHSTVPTTLSPILLTAAFEPGSTITTTSSASAPAAGASPQASTNKHAATTQSTRPKKLTSGHGVYYWSGAIIAILLAIGLFARLLQRQKHQE